MQMSLSRQLWAVGSTAFAALMLVAGLMAAVAALDSSSNGHAMLAPASAALVTFGYTLILGSLPALLVGTPGYVLLLRRGRARWHYALVLGLAPGLLVLFHDPSLGMWASICGAAVALATHLECRGLGQEV